LLCWLTDDRDLLLEEKGSLRKVKAVLMAKV